MDSKHFMRDARDSELKLALAQVRRDSKLSLRLTLALTRVRRDSKLSLRLTLALTQGSEGW